MAISNCLLSPSLRQAQAIDSENPYRFSAWYVHAKLSAKERNYS